MPAGRYFSYINRQFVRTLVKIAGRPGLPGSNGKGFPTYLNEPTQTFPYRILAWDYGVTEDTPAEKCAQALG